MAEIHIDCDVVYAFVNQVGMKVDRRMKQELDMIYLYETHINRLWSMYNYLFESKMLTPMNKRNDSNNPTVQFDFVAHTSTSYVIYPDRVWPLELLRGMKPISTHPSIYMMAAGNTSNPEEAPVEGYTLISTPLIERLFRNRNFTLQNHGGQMGEEMYTEIVKLGPIQDTTTMNHPFNLPDPDVTVVIGLPDVVSKVPKGTFGDLLIQAWDAYKDKHLVTYQDADRVRANRQTDLTKCRYGPRVLLGIMTILDYDLEVQRREVIRETYLNYFNQSQTEGYRICALHNLIDKTHPDHDHLVSECQLAYVFVVGGNSLGVKERVDYSDSEPMTLPLKNLSETDLVLLNIQENMKEGKSQTFMKYAVTIIDDHIYFDYVAKTDSDTLIFTERFLNQDVRHLPSFPDNVRVYGGCNLVSRNEYGETKGPIYFVGSLYFMSVDMARYVTSPACNRSRMAVYSEDQSMGNFIHSHPQPIHRMKLAFPAPFKDRRRGKEDVWDDSTSRHPLKDIGAFRAAWERYLGLLT